MKKIDLFILLQLILLCPIIGVAQCEIPNGDFENWIITDSGGPSYDYPDDGWTESFAYLLSRLSYGTGAFYKYTDADGDALLLQRANSNKSIGFIRFDYDCDNLPSKLKGRYKFSGSDNISETDTLVVAVHFATISDAVPLTNLHQGNYHLNSATFKTFVPQNEFSDFEIDLSSYSSSVPYDYVTIQLLIIAEEYINESVTTAIVDDLKFEFNALTVDEDLEFDENNISIFPNPTSDFITVVNNITNAEFQIIVYNSLGETILLSEKGNGRSKINLSHLHTGIYFLTVKTADNKVYNSKVIKK